MDLASGYSDSINYGNGYTPLANNAIANNNADYLRNQAAIALMAQNYNPYANSGGSFGAQPAYYAGVGADYGRAVGGGGNIYAPQQQPEPEPQPQPAPNTATMFDGLSAADMATWQRAMYGAGRGDEVSQIPSFWQGVRDFTGMGAPGGSGYDPYAGLGNQGQQGVTDPMGYGSGGYQGNDIPYQNRAPVQGGTTDPFWQGIRDLAGADPKDQSRIPNAFGTGAPAFSMYGMSPGDMATWTRAMQAAGRGNEIPQQQAQDPYYWSGNFFGANNGSGIGQGEGMAPGMGGFNNPGVPTSPQQWYGAGGYNPYDPQTYGGSAQQNLGTGQPNVSNTQNTVFDTGASAFNPYASQPWWNNFAAAAGPQGVSDWLQSKGISGATDFSSQSRGLEGTNYNTFQGGAPQWANSIPGNDPNLQNAIYRAAGNTGLYPSALAGVMNEESRWNPRDTTSGNYGIPQMSADMWGDSPFNGQMAGQTFQQFRDGSGANQIDAYADWLNRSGNLYKGGIDVAAQNDPVMQAALLQGIQFGGNAMGWRNALAGGNMNVPVTTSPQAQNLGTTSINDMYNAYDQMMTPQWTGQWTPSS